jgi:23S rRNA pseudouridine2605 synthase
VSGNQEGKGGTQTARGERIAKWLARAGVASRRDAERLIADGRVTLNRRRVETPATFVRPGDLVAVDGRPVAPPERTRLFRYHKPPGLVTTHRDPQGRPTVFERLPTGLPRLVSVGRLDLTSEGLLLLTNDGALARRLELPAQGWLRRYRVRVYGKLDERDLAALARGVTIDGITYGPIEAGVDSRRGLISWLTVSLREGKNREIRRVLEHLGLQVTRLIRVAHGPFQLGALPRGAVEEVSPKVLREQLGLQAAPPPPRQRRPPAATPAAPPAPAAATRPRRPPRARHAGEDRRRRGGGRGLRRLRRDRAGGDAADHRRAPSRPPPRRAARRRNPADRRPRAPGAVRHALARARLGRTRGDRGRARARRLRRHRRRGAGGALARRRARDFP